jgi:hypothetical protein
VTLRQPGRRRRLRCALALAALLGAALCAAAAAAAPGGGLLRLQPISVHDPVARTTAFRMLAPAGWKRQGGIVWDLRYASVASASFRLRSPNGREALEIFPLYPQTWDEKGILGFPPGSLYLGQEVRRPTDAATFLEQVIVPAVRGRLGARAVQRARLPRVAAGMAALARRQGVDASFDAARLRIAYSENGRPVHEDFYVILSYSRSPLLPTTTLWRPETLYSFKAPRGQLARVAPLLHAAIASVRVELKWYSDYLYVQRLWTDGQMKAIRAAGEISRTIARASDEISALTRQSYEQQQSTYDRIYRGFSESVRGVETYVNPFEGREVELPGQYRYAWAGANGTYLLTNNAGLDPNVGSTIEFRQLRTAP